jgi:hypothetical protein
MNEHPITLALANPFEAPRLAEPGDFGPELAVKERPPFPPNSPVKPLGINSDISGAQKCFYLNWNGQLVGLEASTKHGKLGLIALYGPSSEWLEAHFPQWSKPIYEGLGKARVLIQASEIIGFDQAKAARAMVEECTRRGIFDPAGRMRGRGAHRSDAGGLVLHCGDKLRVSVPSAKGGIKAWDWADLGQHEGYVYPAASAIPRPWHEPVGPKVAQQLLAVLQTWNWKRELLDPRFFLGGIGMSMIGGASPWRSNIWITGGSGTGKSELNGKDKLLHKLFGDGCFRTGNTSEAAIRQTLKNSTVPVMLDEIENSEDNRRIIEVVKLARVSSSGDSLHRGGNDHVAHEFTLQSHFWFSSVLMPPLEPQDRNRLAILELGQLPDKLKPLPVLPLAEMGRKLQRRMSDAWPWLADVADVYKGQLSIAGHDARGCAQFGWLLACADALTENCKGDDWRPDPEHVLHWVSLCRPDRMREITEATPDHIACVQHIATHQAQAKGGEERSALGSWIGHAVAAAAPAVSDDHGDRAAVRLQQMGLRLVNLCRVPATNGKPARWGVEKYRADAPGFLAVAGSHQGLNPIFAATKWQHGVHKQSLSRCPGAVEGVQVRFGHTTCRAVLVPLYHVLDDDELAAPSRREEFMAWRAEMGDEQEEGAGG